MARLIVNGAAHDLAIDDDTPLLWALRDGLGLTGTKYGCGRALCGACAVHVEGEVVWSCSVPVGAVAGKSIVTIEGLAPGGIPNAIQQAWIDDSVVQCGYCHPGIIMAVAGLLAANPRPSEADIAAAVPNICRCGTYPRIRRAIEALARR
jgi:isoquinoline 1-oxidoreductase subunit alpha